MSEDARQITREKTLQAVTVLAQSCETELAHTLHVTRLALRLFDETLTLHQLGSLERDWLEYAGLLHDIGWVEGRKEHHKTSLRIILTTSVLPFDSKQRLVIGSIARYHRRAEPSEKHDHFTALDPDERRRVVMLSAILRVADALDRNHKGAVKDMRCKVGGQSVRITCLAEAQPEDEFKAIVEKGNLFEKVFTRKIKLDWKTEL